MGGIESDLGCLDLTDDVKGSIVLSDTERERQLDSEGGVARGNELGSVSRIPGRSEVGRAFQVGEDAYGFGLATLSRRGVECIDASLVSDGVYWCRVVKDVKEVHSVGRALLGKGRSTEGGQDFED